MDNSRARFRAWDEIEKKMWFPIIRPDGRLMASNQMGGYVTYDDPQDPLMQYTGLKDKNGTEIYEGDIVDIYGTSHEVGFHACSWVITCNGEIEFLRSCGELSVIIGNIHESPEVKYNYHPNHGK